MTRISRVLAKLFCGNAPANNIAQFASYAAGVPYKTRDIPTIQALEAWELGWTEATKNLNIPPAVEDMNAVFFVLSYFINYILQEGIAEYDKNTVYYKNSFVKLGKEIYYSVYEKTEGFSNQSPLLQDQSLNSNYWGVVVSPASILEKLLTVDGAGSALDADLLDNKQGSEYVQTAGNQTVDGKKTFTTPPAGVSNLAKHNDGVTAANIFAKPPLNTMGAVSCHHFEANPFPAANKSPIQSGGAESWEVITLNLSHNRAAQIAMQVFNGGNQGRVFIRCRHIDNSDYSQWQAWRESAKNADSPSFAGSLSAGGGANIAGGLKVGGGAGALKIGDDAQFEDVNEANALALDGQQNPRTTSHLYLWRGGERKKVIAEGDSPSFGGLALSGSYEFNCQAPFLPRTPPVPGSISVTGDFTPQEACTASPSTPAPITATRAARSRARKN